MSNIILFDLDGTLAHSTKNVSDEMYETLKKLKNMGYILGIVGGGEHKKCTKQLDKSLKLFDYIFSECGSVIYKLETTFTDNSQKYKEISRKNIVEHLGSIKIKHIGDTFLSLLVSDNYIDHLNCEQYGINIPIHVDIRSGLIYLTPVGMNSNDEYRKLFVEYDKHTKWRNSAIKILSEISSDSDLIYTIGGEVGIACYPKNWNKSQIIPYLKTEGFDKLYFFGDKTEPNGNDYPLYISPDVIGYSVKSPCNTEELLKKIFMT